MEETVVDTADNSVTCIRHEKGLPMNVAYGDVRLFPDNEIARSLAKVYVEDNEE